MYLKVEPGSTKLKDEPFRQKDKPEKCRVKEEPYITSPIIPSEFTSDYFDVKPVTKVTSLLNLTRGEQVEIPHDFNGTNIDESGVSSPSSQNASRKSDLPEMLNTGNSRASSGITPGDISDDKLRVKWDISEDDTDESDFIIDFDVENIDDNKKGNNGDLAYVELVVDQSVSFLGNGTYYAEHHGSESESRDTSDVHQSDHKGSSRKLVIQPAQANVGPKSNAAKGAKRRQCSLCPRKFQDKSRLKLHLLSHTRERPHECNICGVYIRYDLNAHIRNVHTPHSDRKFKCRICSWAFNKISAFKRHMTSHTDEKPYACDICSRRFKVKGALTKHVAIKHRSEGKANDYACNQCDKSFTCLYSLNMHIRIHSGEKPYKCDVCEMRFVRKDALAVHKARHDKSKFVCSACGVKFYKRTLLFNHVTELHKGGELHPCNLCDRAYCSKSSLAKHMKCHVEKHVCAICNKVLSTKMSLKRHILLKHEKTQN